MPDNENWDVTAGRLVFEWDEKRLSNVEKHGIDFADRLDVFVDPAAFIYLSARSAAEGRYVLVGRVKEKSVSVVFVRRGSLIRLISARISRRNERRLYEAKRKQAD